MAIPRCEIGPQGLREGSRGRWPGDAHRKTQGYALFVTFSHSDGARRVHGGGQPMPLARRCTPVKHNGKPCLSSVHAVTRARRVHGRAVAADGQATHNHVAQGYTLFAMSSHRVHSSVCAAYTGTRVKAGIRRLSVHVRSRCCTLDCLATAVIQLWQERPRAVAGRWPGDAPPHIRVSLVSREFTG